MLSIPCSLFTCFLSLNLKLVDLQSWLTNELQGSVCLCPTLPWPPNSRATGSALTFLTHTRLLVIQTHSSCLLDMQFVNWVKSPLRTSGFLSVDFFIWCVHACVCVYRYLQRSGEGTGSPGWRWSPRSWDPHSGPLYEQYTLSTLSRSSSTSPQ